jgi:hypothetical protein
MHDAGKVIFGLVIFLAIVALPAWQQALTGELGGPPDLKIESKSPVCVAETAFMRSLHMDLLNDWRDEAVRDGDRTYVGLEGVEYEKSIGATCLGSCHTSQEEFCDRCHDYVGAEVYCWGCHAEQKAEAEVVLERVELMELAGMTAVGELVDGELARSLGE